VTTIGGTAFIHPFGIGEEEGYDISGGGFSNVFKMPDYQADNVKHYFETADQDKVCNIIKNVIFRRMCI